MTNLKSITILQPPRTVFGPGCFEQFVTDTVNSGRKKLFVVTIASMTETLAPAFQKLAGAGIEVKLDQSVTGEPSFAGFETVLEGAKAFDADGVVGIGGGSVLDVAKLAAAQLRNTQATDDVKGIGNLKERQTHLVCIPTTAGTGSEVSPNAIFLNASGDKIGVISPFLVPDAAYVDPMLTLSVPPFITAATGIDALAHCLEAYTNKFAHPVIDTIALEGVRLVSSHLLKAVMQGEDVEARTAVALGSMYGGMCLGPVNTTAAHALAYPLGADYHLSHGLSVALLLPAVMEYNLVASPERFAAVALALGADRRPSALETATEGVRLMKALIAACGLPTTLKDAKIEYGTIDKMAADAMKVQRLLKNNCRDLTQKDAANIFKAAFGAEGRKTIQRGGSAHDHTVHRRPKN